MFRDYFKLSVRSVKEKGIRSWLTMVGIFIGITAVVALISIGQGFQIAVEEQFEMMGTNIVMIMPGSGLTTFGTTAAILTQEDREVIEKVKGVGEVAGLLSKLAKIEYSNEIKYTWVTGMPTDESQRIILDMGQVSMEQGQKEFKPTDKYKTAVGYRLAYGDLFKKTVKLRDNIKIEEINSTSLSVDRG